MKDIVVTLNQLKSWLLGNRCEMKTTGQCRQLCCSPISVDLREQEASGLSVLLLLGPEGALASLPLVPPKVRLGSIAA